MLVIICGHGEGDPGAVGNGYQEATLVRELARRIEAFGGDAVIIGDTSKNWYKRGMVNNTNIPKGAKVLELHIDKGVVTARGGHVVIDADFEPDKWDIALAEFISSVLPGRSEIIKKRNDLANPNRAEAAGINYRLLECGFISNAEDMKIFTTHMDDIAKGILACFHIDAEENKKPTTNQAAAAPSVTPVASKKDLGQVNVTYQAYTNRWWPEVVNQNDWAGKGDGTPIRYLAIKVNKGKVRGRVYTEKSGWLPYLTFANSYDLNDLKNGVLGDGSPIQAVELYYYTPDGYLYKKIHYKVSSSESKQYYAVQVDNEKNKNMDGYAGKIGTFVDKFQAWIE